MDIGTDIARTEARTWFARLRAHDCSAEDHAAFERWRASDSRHAEAYADLEEIWDLSAELAQEDVAIAAAARDARRVDMRSWLGRHRWQLMAAAVAVLAACGWFSVMLLQSEAPAYQYATAAGEQRTLTLEDGTLVVLDTASTLEVRYGRSHRSLVLQQGQADFKVHKDPSRPFTVEAGLVDVTATGTQFQVRRLAGGAGRVTLLEGQVVVASRQSAGKTTLEPGQRVDVDALGALGAVRRMSEADRANAEGWTLGQLVVREWPLATLVTEINRYGRTPLRLGDASVGRLSVSGTFAPTEPQSVALTLQYGWPVRVEQGAGEIVLYARK